MDFELSQDQRAFRDTARQFATERMLPDAAAHLAKLKTGAGPVMALAAEAF